MSSAPDESNGNFPLAAEGLRGVAFRALARESDVNEPRRPEPLSRIEVTHTGGPSQAIGPVGAGELTIGLQIAGDGAFILVDEDDLVDPTEVR